MIKKIFENKKRLIIILIVLLLINISIYSAIDEDSIDITSYPNVILPLYEDAYVTSFEDLKNIYKLEFGSDDDVDDLVEYYYELFLDDNDYEITGLESKKDEYVINVLYDGKVILEIFIEDAPRLDDYDTYAQLKVYKKNLDKIKISDEKADVQEEPSDAQVEPAKKITATQEPLNYSDITIEIAHTYSYQEGIEYESMEQAKIEIANIYPGINIELMAYDLPEFIERLQIWEASGDSPDLMVLSWGNFMRNDYIADNLLLNLSPFYNEDTALKEKLPEDTLTDILYNDNIYGYPVGEIYLYMYYNIDIFERVGVDFPKTYNDLIDACEQFKQADIIPISLSGQFGWSVMFEYSGLALNTAGATAFKEALQGKRSFIEEPFIEAARQLQYMAESGYFGPVDVTSVDYTVAGKLFGNGEAAMYYMGDWAYPNLKDDVNTGIALWPIDDPKDRNDRVGGSDTICSVSAFTEHPELAENIAALLAEHMSKVRNVPAFTNVFAETNNVFTNAVEGADETVFLPDIYINSSDIGDFYDYFKMLVNFEVTPEEFCRLVDDIT